MEYNPEEVEELAPGLPYVEGDGSDATEPQEFLELCYAENPCPERWNSETGDYEFDPDCNTVVEEPMQAIAENAEDSVLTLENILTGGVDFTVVTVRSYQDSNDSLGDIELDNASFFITPESYNDNWSFADAVDSWIHQWDDFQLLFGMLSGFPTDNVYCNAMDWDGTGFFTFGKSLETGYADAHATDECALSQGEDPADCMYIHGFMPQEDLSGEKEYLIGISASGDTTFGNVTYTGEETEFPIQDTMVVPFEEAVDDLLRTGTVYASNGKIIHSRAYDDGEGYLYTVQVSILEERFEVE
ncbi:hypothetical protein CL619_01730 [archaeon]|nr:hypothetical protein [archaeon]